MEAPSMPVTAGAIDRRTLEVQATLLIKEKIFSGEIGQGERLLESKLADQLGLSRGTIKLALQALVSEGLVEMQPYRGATVRTMTPEQEREVVLMRHTLDPIAVQAAATRMTPEKAAYLRTKLADLLNLARRGRKVETMHADLALHAAIVECSDNALLQEVYGLVMTRTRLSMLSGKWVGTEARLLGQQHTELINAICQGDSAAAMKCIHFHSQELVRLHDARALKHWT